MECNDFPEVGTRLTYGEAIPVYDRFERSDHVGNVGVRTAAH